jgi:hypothetical protein
VKTLQKRTLTAPTTSLIRTGPIPTVCEIRSELDWLMAIVRSNSGVSRRPAEFIWAAHCGSGQLNFSLFSSLDKGNLNRAKKTLNYRLNPAVGGYELPLSICERDFLHGLCTDSLELT